MSTAWVVTECIMVEAMVTNRIWNSDVPTTTRAPMPRIYSMAGTMMKPPPTPSNMVSTPVRKPRIIGAMGEI